ncbi:MAG: SBBP repeat-containing protein [Peptococcaceae bacterium]|nr:SBBP repeat-containing protein [Peptococcaceae bacterium]
MQKMITSRLIFWILVCLLFYIIISAFSAHRLSPACAHEQDKNKSIEAKDYPAAISTLNARVPFIADGGPTGNGHVMFYAKTFGGTVYVTRQGELVYNLPLFESKKSREKPVKEQKKNPPEDSPVAKAEINTGKGWVLREKFLGNWKGEPGGVKKSSTKVNYFHGSDKNKWEKNIAAYDSISLGGVFNGVDLVLNAYGNNVEKIFIVSPGSEVSDIKVKIEGAIYLKVNDKGELEVGTGFGPVCFSAPVAYQEKEGIKEYIKVSYQQENNTYGFKVADYDRTRPLFIDPLLSSTFVGGSDFESAYAMALDGTGNIYVAGDTYSTDFPTAPGAYDNSHGGYRDIVILKLDNSMSSLLASTYIGGSDSDCAYSLAVDGEGNIYMAGTTRSTDYPSTPGSYNSSHNGSTDVVISKLDGNLSTLLASTCIGGSDTDYPCNTLVIDESNNVYMAGDTYSTNFPTTTGAFDTSANGRYDVFVLKLSPELSSLLASTFIGGSDTDVALSLSADSSGNLYVSGYTYSSNYPTTAGAYSPVHNGSYVNGFASKLDAGLNNLLASTYIGGSSYDYALSNALDINGNVYITGYTYSSNFPTTAGAYDTSHNGAYDAFVSKFDNQFSSLLASTFIGGNDYDLAKTIAVSESGDIYIAGDTYSPDYPTTEGAYDESYNGRYDVFITKLDSGLANISASTYMGGKDWYDHARALAIDNEGNVYVAGCTYSPDFPTTGDAYDTSYNGIIEDGYSAGDIYVSKLSGELSLEAQKNEDMIRATFGRDKNTCFGNDPVNLSTGNFVFEKTDLEIPTRGVPLEFTRFYNSLDSYNGPLGRGWTHSYNSHLNFNTDGSISVSYPDGHVIVFKFDGVNYIRPAGCFELLSPGPNNTYILTFKDQKKYAFNSAGQLISIADKNGNTISLTYAENLLSTVTEPAGRSFTFTYDTNNHITSINDTVNRAVYFTYDENGYLANVQDVLGGVTQYHYDDHGLTQIIDPYGNTILENTYDASSRVIQQTDGSGNVTHFAYNPSARQTAMTDPIGFSATITYDDKYRTTSITYSSNITEAYTYDDNGCLNSIKDKNGHTTVYACDSMGNVLTKTDPAPLSYVTSYTYNSFNSPTRVVDAAGYVTDYTYDDRGNLLTVSRAVYGGTATTTFTYNEYGQVTAITDANGKTTSMEYDQYGNLASVTDAVYNTTTYTYDILGRRLTVTDPRGNLPGADPARYTWTYTYDAFGNVLSETDPLGNETTNTYDLEGNLLSTTDPRGNTTTFTYDLNDKLVKVIDPLGHTTTYGYDANGNRISVTDAVYNTTTYGYDFLGRLTSVTDPSGKTESYTLDGNGNIIAKTDRRGNTTSYTYDVLNRPTMVTDALGNTFITEYDPLGNRVSVTDQNNNTTRYTYDQGSRLLSVTDPLGRTTTYAYDLVGNRLSATDPRGATWTYSYDDANRLITVTDPLGHVSRTEYDSVGNAVCRTDANNVTTGFQYDPLNRLVSVTDALGYTTGYTYDQNGNLTAVTDARDKVSTFEYDALNRLVREADPLGNATRLEYDPAGRLTARTRPDNTVIRYSYDVNNRPTGITYPDGTGVTYSYDENGNRTSMTDPGGTTSYAYDNLNRLTSVTRGNCSTGYSYDPAGNITGITYPDGLYISYGYNGLNLPVSVSDSVYSATISYDEAGNRIKEVLPNGIEVNYQYDLNGRLTVLQHVYGTGVLSGVAYTLDNVGNRLSATDEQGQTTRYTYDPINQLTKVEYPDGQSVEFTYDPAGNRTVAGEVSYLYDDANRLIQAGTVPYGYDTNGNLVSVGEAVYYNYDYENRLVSYTDGTETISYTYDGDGIRTGQSVSGSVYGTYEYIYDYNAGLPRLLVEKDNSGKENNYIYAGRLYSRIGTEGQVFYHHDGLGSISVISDVYGNPLNHYTYDAFGSPRSVIESVYNPIRFTGEPYDPSGLIYLRARYYDPTTGRFLTPDNYPGIITDPLSMNRYSYCSNNPILYLDPSGHIAICYQDSSLSIPTSPPGVNIDDNIRQAESMFPNVFKWKEQVDTFGPWDYKQIDSKYEDFGNFNYGATGSAIGIPENVLLRAAGFIQQRDNSGYNEKFGHWYGKPPYGDDPNDQIMIKKGIEYYNNVYLLNKQPYIDTILLP